MPWVKTGSVYQLKITLRDTHPPIWRRVLVPGHFTLGDLHWVIQVAMGWTNSHLHHFRVGETFYSLPTPYTDWEDANEKDSTDMRLDTIAPEAKVKFIYEYDFGDSWEHEILVEKIFPPDPKLKSPVCLKGARACPPEDVGGVWGYAEFLRAIKNPKHKEHRMYMDWSGGDFDPVVFDLDATNKLLKKIK